MKSEIRKTYLQKRSQMPKEQQEDKSKRIMDMLISSEEYKSCNEVFVYINMGSEVITKDFIQKAWQGGKKVAVPVTRKKRVMYFLEIHDFEHLNKTKFGTSEPAGEIEEQSFPTENTLFIVPGSVFDENKNRCGYGGGFYDIYIEKYQIKKPIAICFDFQVLKEIEAEEFDEKMFKIITENRVII